jgi:hypothetical protein
MTLELPDLPYAYEALEPLISAATLRTHHGKHSRAPRRLRGRTEATPRAELDRAGCRPRDRVGCRPCKRCPRGCIPQLQRLEARPQALPAPSRSRPRHRPSLGRRRTSRSARRPRASPRREPLRGPRSRARRRRPNSSWRPQGIRLRLRRAPSPRPTRSEAGGVCRLGAGTAGGHTASGGLSLGRVSQHKPTRVRKRSNGK